MRLRGEVNISQAARLVGLPDTATEAEVRDELAAQEFVGQHFPELGGSVAQFPAAGVDDADDGPNTLDEFTKGSAARTIGY